METTAPLVSCDSGETAASAGTDHTDVQDTTECAASTDKDVPIDAAAFDTSEAAEEAMMNACRRGRFEDATRIMKSMEMSFKSYRSGRSLLHVAAEHGCADVVDLLLSKGLSVDLRDGYGKTPLIDAASERQEGVVNLLLTREASVDAADRWGWTALHCAARFGYVTIVELLLSRRVSVDGVNSDGQTALQYASEWGHVNTAMLLLDRGANIDAADNDGRTALYHAVKEGRRDVIRLLLDRGANTGVRGNDSRTALHFAVEKGDMNMVELLLFRKVSSDVADLHIPSSPHDSSGWSSATTSSHLEMHEGSTEPTDKSREARARVEDAEGQLDDMEVPMRSRASVLIPDRDGVTPLHAAARHGSIEIVKTLVGLFTDAASWDSVDRNGDTPTLAAARVGHFEIVRVLLQAGASAHVRSADGETLLLSAARFGDSSVVYWLSELGCLVDRVGASGNNEEEEETSSMASHSSRSATPPPSLLSLTLQTLCEYASQAYEFETLWSRVAERLTSIYVRMLRSTESQQSTSPNSQQSTSHENIFQLAMIAFHFAQLKATCSSRSVFARLVACTDVATQIRDIHTELTFLEQRLPVVDLCVVVSGHNEWESECASDERTMVELFRSKIATSDPSGWIASEDDGLYGSNSSSSIGHGNDGATKVTTKSRDEDEAKFLSEAVTLLQHHMLQSDNCSQELSELLTLSLRKVQESGRVKTVQAVPDWLIPFHEFYIDIDALKSQRLGELRGAARVVRGRWAGSLLVCSDLDHEKFGEVVDACSKLNHPNVVKVYGVSHRDSSNVAALESAVSTELSEYINREGHEDEAYQKLFEVALGLQYLLERSIFVDRLNGNDVWVGSDGVAKICLLQCHPCARRELFFNSRAPELQRGKPSTPASSVYAFGELARSLCWQVKSKLPELSDLIAWMRSETPEDRPTIASVVLELRCLAQRKTQFSMNTHTVTSRSDVQSSAWLETARHTDFLLTIPEWIERLKMKCGNCNESQDAVDHIFERMRDVLRVIREQCRQQDDVAVESYIRLLEHFDRFLRVAVSDKSILMRAKSQKVSLESQVFHRRLDDLIELLKPATVDRIHDWQSHPTSRSSSQDSQLSSVQEVERPVRITRFGSDQTASSLYTLDGTTSAIGAPSGRTAVTAPSYYNAIENADSTPAWLIHIHELDYNPNVDKIGVGSFGDVYKATWNHTPVVVKFMGYEEDADAYDHELFDHELRVWLPLNHPNVLKLFGANHVGKRYFVCEHASNGNLLAYVKTSDANAARRWQLLHQVGRGLQYLHEQSVTHNDLRCDNVLIDANGDAKIIDFGLSSMLNRAEVSVDPKKQGAVQWRSPEYLRGERLTTASDVYSFGMLIIELVTGEAPWGRNCVEAIVRARVRRGVLPPQPASMSDTQWHLICMMCAPKPTQRVGMSFVVKKLNQLSQQRALEQQEKQTLNHAHSIAEATKISTDADERVVIQSVQTTFEPPPDVGNIPDESKADLLEGSKGTLLDESNLPYSSVSSPASDEDLHRSSISESTEHPEPAPATQNQERQLLPFSVWQEICRRGDEVGIQERLQSVLCLTAKDLAELVSTALDNGHAHVSKLLLETGTTILCMDLRETAQLVSSVFKRVITVLSAISTRVSGLSEAPIIKADGEEKKSEHDPITRCKSVVTQLLSLCRSLSQPRTVFVAIARSRHVLMCLERMLRDLEDIKHELKAGLFQGSNVATIAVDESLTATGKEDSSNCVGGNVRSLLIEDWEELVAIRDEQLTFALQETRDVSGVLPDRPSQIEALTYLKYELDLLTSEANEETAAMTWRKEILTTALEKASKYSRIEIAEVNVPKWFVPSYMVDWHPERYVGDGSLGSVHRVRMHRQSHSQDLQLAEPVAVKELKMFGLGGTRSDRAFFRDVRVWYALSHEFVNKDDESERNNKNCSFGPCHPHIAKLLGACHVSRRAFVVLEPADHGNLLDYLKQQQQSDNYTMLMLEKFVEAAKALEYLHNRGICHGHLKCANIVVMGDGRAKLTDFGFDDVRSAVCAVQEGPAADASSSSSHSLQWMAPELLVRGTKDVTHASDVFALGMCLLEAIALGLPWGDIDESELLEKIEAGDLPPCKEEGYRRIWELASEMCKKTPSERIPLDEVIEGLQELIDNLDEPDNKCQGASQHHQFFSMRRTSINFSSLISSMNRKG